MSAKTRHLLLLSNSTLHPTGYLEYAKEYICDFLQGQNVKKVLFVPYALRKQDDYACKAKCAFQKWGFEVDSIHEAENPVQVQYSIYTTCPCRPVIRFFSFPGRVRSRSHLHRGWQHLPTAEGLVRQQRAHPNSKESLGGRHPLHRSELHCVAIHKSTHSGRVILC